MDPKSHEFETDDEEVIVFTARERWDQLRTKPADLRRTLPFFGLAASLLFAIVSLTALSRADLWPGLHNTTRIIVDKVDTSLLRKAGQQTTGKKPMAPSDAQLIRAVFDETSTNTFFEEIQMDDGTVSYQHRNGLLVTAKMGQYVVSSPSVPGSMQFFGKKTNEDGTIALMVHGGSWLTALPSGEIVANGANITASQTFTLEKGENGTIALRNIHGKYIGLNQTLGEEFAVDRKMLVNKDGFGSQATAAEAVSVITMAEASSIGSRQKFTLIKNAADDTVSVKTKYNTFLTSPMDGLVSGDSTVACGREAFALIFKHGKVYLRTFDGSYITADRRGFLLGHAKLPGLWESFDMESNDDGTIALKSSQGKYITAIKVALLPDGGDWAFEE